MAKQYPGLPTYDDLMNAWKRKNTTQQPRPTMLDAAMEETIRYAQQGSQQRQNVANTLTGGMTQRKQGDIKTWDWDLGRRTILDNEIANKYFREQGLFNTEDYAFNNAYVHLVGDDYLKSLLPVIGQRIADAQKQDEAYAQRNAYRVNTWQHWSDMQNRLGEMNEANAPYFYAYADYLMNGDMSKPFDMDAYDAAWDEMDDDAFEADMEAKKAKFEGVDWAKATDKNASVADQMYESEVGKLEGYRSTVEEELLRGAELEAMQAEIRSHADYGTLSVYNDTYTAPEKGTAEYIFGNERFTNGYDIQQRFMNADASWAQKTIAAEYSPAVQKYLDEGYDYLTPDELADYNALYNAGRLEDAEHYLELLRPELLYRRAMVMKSYTEAKATNPYLAVPSWMDARIQNVANVFYLPQQIYETATGRDNPYSSAFDAANKVAYTTGAQLGAIQNWEAPEALKDVVSYAYQGVTGATDNTMRLVSAGFNPTASLIIAGLQSASGSLKESAERDDMSAAAKIVKAIGTAAIEVGTEKIGLDALFDTGKSGAMQYIKNVVLSELGEETLNYISGDALEAVVAFLFEHEADIKSGAEFWEGLTDTAITTILSSLLMGGGGAIAQDMNTRATGKQLLREGDIEGMLKIAESMPAESASAQEAAPIRELQKGGKKVSTRQLGKLVNAVAKDIGDQNAATVNRIYEEAIEDRLVELGEDAGSAKKLAPVIRRVSKGEKIPLRERAEIAWTDNASKVVKELATDTSEGENWKAQTQGKLTEAAVGTLGKAAQFREALTSKTSNVTAASKAAERAKALTKGNKGKNKLQAKELAFDDGAKGQGEFKKVIKDGDTLKVGISIDGSDQLKEVSVDSLTGAGDEGLATILEYAAHESRHAMSAEEINIMAGTYAQQGGDAQEFIQQFEDSYLAGYSGVEKKPTGGLMEIAYEHGRYEAVKDEKNRVARAKEARSNAAPTVGWLGDVTSDADVTGSGDAKALDEAIKGMTEGQQLVVEFAKNLSRNTGLNIVLFRSKAMDGGSISTQNGSYDASTNTIYLDVNAGVNNAAELARQKEEGTLGYAIMRTMGHEVTHAIEATSVDFYDQYKQAVKDELTAGGKDWAQLVRQKLDNAMRAGQKLTYAGAEAEVVADASEYMLQDSQFVSNMDAGLKNKVKRIMQDFIGKIRAAFKALTGGHEESLALRTMRNGVMQYSERLQKLWDAGFMEMATAKVREDYVGEATEMVEENAGAYVSYADEAKQGTVQKSAREKQYMEAVRGGDMETARKMVDEAAKRAGYTTKVYHGTQNFGFTVIDPKYSDDKMSFFATDSLDVARTYSDVEGEREIGTTRPDNVALDKAVKEYRNAVADYVSRANAIAGVDNAFAYDDPRLDEIIKAATNGEADIARSDLEDYYISIEDVLVDWLEDEDSDFVVEDYFETDEYKSWHELIIPVFEAFDKVAALAEENTSSGNYGMYANTDLMFEVDAKGSQWNRIKTGIPALGVVTRTRSIARYAKEHGYTGVKIANLFDDGGRSRHYQRKPATVYVFFNPQEQVKSADPVTYDGDGNVIPLSERFNTANADIRYSHRGENVSEEDISEAIGIDEDTESAYPAQYSIRTWANSDYVTKQEEAAKRLANAIGVSVPKAKKWIKDVNSVSAYILSNKARLDYIPTAVKGMSAFKSNPEYGGSIDMSTICAKRRLATGTLDAIQRALGDAVLTKDDFLHIREIMKERGYEVACGLCFVESSRKNLSKYNRQFLDQYREEHPDANIGMVDLNTVEGLEALRSNPETANVYEAYEKFMNKLDQRKPKLFEKRTEYNHEILKRFRNDSTVQEKNKNGGMRLQSFSDFEIVHLIDMMQVITDMASVGLAGQAYTKVPDFAWALGKTGLKINLSLIAKDVDENGNLVFDDVEGMNHLEAKRLRDAYSKNVGTIVVTFTDEQTIAAMQSDFIDFIIPFHRSQWQKGDYKKLGLPEGTKDYTLHQNEKLGRKRVKENFMPNRYWDFRLTGKQNAKRYLDMCAAEGRTPKFAKFLVKNSDGSYDLQPDGSTDGYWKLLIDFKMYDNAGKGSPQLPVKPEFNMDEAMRMLEEYKGEHDTFPVAQDVVEDFVKEYTGNKGGVTNAGGRYMVENVQLSRRDTTDQTETEGFKRWFGNSVVVNEDGSPKVMYHGTSAENGEFWTFDYSKAVKKGGLGLKALGEGMYFTAKKLDGTEKYGSRVLQVYLKIENPFIPRVMGANLREAVATQLLINVDDVSKNIQDTLKQHGYDGIINGEIAVVFSPTQIKSATDNVGTFDPQNPDIRYSRRDEEYMDAVNSGDTSKARQLVAEAAKEAGYKPLRLYHGTRSFGFTKFDVGKSDDKLSIFATDSLRIAESYSGENANRNLKKASKEDRYEFLQRPSAELLPYVHEHIGEHLRLPTEREMRDYTDEASTTILKAFDAIQKYLDDHNDTLRIEAKQALTYMLTYAEKMAKFMTLDMEDEADGYMIRMKYEDAKLDLSFEDRDAYDALYDVAGRPVIEAANKLLQARFSDPFYNEKTKTFVSKWDVTDRLGDAIFSGIYDLYGIDGNLFEMDANDANWNTLDGSAIGREGVFVNTRAVAEYAKENGYDGVLIKNVRDGGGMTPYHGASNVFVYFNNTALKSADLVTYDDNGDVIPLSERFDKNQEDIRYSRRDEAPDGVSIREFLGGMKPTERMTETEKLLLKRYQENLRTLEEKEKLVAEQEEIIRTAPIKSDELTMAKNRYQIYRTQANRAARALMDAERSEGFARVMATSQEVVNRYLLGSAGAVGDAADVLDEEIAGLTAQLKAVEADVTRTASGQRTAFARGLFDQKQLNEAAQKLKDTYGSRMSVKAIADRLALAYGEIYAENGAEGAKLFMAAARDLAEDMLRGNKFRYKSEILPMLAEQIGTISLTETDVQEIRNAGLTVSEYKRMLSPYIKVVQGGSGLSSYASNAAYYGEGALASVLGEDIEGNLAMRLYEVISREKDQEAEISYEGMSEGQLIAEAMADIAGANLPMSTDSKTVDYLRKELLKYAGENAQAAQKVEQAIMNAQAATRRASGVWRAAVQEVNTAKQAVEYYRKLEEQRRLTELKEQKQEITAQLRSDYAKKLEEKVQKQRTEYREREQKAREYRHSREELDKLRRRIGRNVKRLNTMRMRETDQRHVPQEFQHLANAVMQTFTDSSLAKLAFSAEKTASLARRYRLLQEVESDMTYYWDDEIEGEIENLVALSEAYTAIREREAGVPSYFSVEGVKLETEILTGVDNIVSNVLQMIDSANDAFLLNRNETFEAYATKTGEEIRKKQDYKQFKGWLGKAQKMVDENIHTGNMTPIYFMEHLNSPLLKEVFDEVRMGQSDYAKIVAQGKDFVQDAKEKYHYGAWVADGKLKMKTSQGHQIELTREEAAELYAIAKRESTNKLYQTEHLLYGGFQYKDITKKGEGLYAAKKESHQLDAADIDKISRWLTDEQKAYADTLVGFLSTTMADYGNAASMEMYGYKKFKEAYYIPFHTAAEQRFQRGDEGPQGENAGTGRLKNSGFTKKLQHGANATLVVGGLTDTVSEHIHKMATYAAMVQPIENMKRLLNHQVMEPDGTVNTIRALIGQKYGQASQDYMAQLLKDLNGAAMGDERATDLVNSMIGAFKRGAVMASASVVMQQPTAMARAMAYISPKYFAQNPFYRPGKGTWDEMMKYAGTAVIKDMGKFDVGMGLTARQYIADEHLSAMEAYSRLKADSKWEAGKEAYKRAVDWLTAAPGKADQWTWGLIWKAVKAEQAELHPGMDVNSEEFLQLCGDRFDDVIDHTQVYDSVITRSNLMRSKNGFHRMATSFMSEPTLSINMLYDAFLGKHDKKQRGKILGGVIVSQVLAGAMAALAQAWNDDEDKRNWLERYADRATANILDNLNPLGMLPYVSDLMSLFAGYEVERPDMAAIADIIDYGKTFISKAADPEKTLTWKDYENFVGTLVNMAGLPAKNISREVRRTRNLIMNSQWTAPDAFSVGQAMLENVPFYQSKNAVYYERIVAAELNGDTQKAQDYREYMLLSKMVSEDAMQTGLKKAMQERFISGDADEDAAKQYLLKIGAYDTESDAHWELDKWKDMRDEGIAAGDYRKYADFFQAVETGENLRAVIKEYLDNGVSKTTLASKITTQYKQQLIDLKASGKGYADLQARLLTAYEALGYDRAQKQKDIQKWFEKK